MKPAIKIKYIETEGDLLATSNNNFVQTNAGYGGYVGDVDVVLLMELDSESLCDFESALQKKWYKHLAMSVTNHNFAIGKHTP